jgi:hypothetical protein
MMCLDYLKICARDGARMPLRYSDFAAPVNDRVPGQRFEAGHGLIDGHSGESAL